MMASATLVVPSSWPGNASWAMEQYTGLDQLLLTNVTTCLDASSNSESKSASNSRSTLTADATFEELGAAALDGTWSGNMYSDWYQMQAAYSKTFDEIFLSFADNQGYLYVYSYSRSVGAWTQIANKQAAPWSTDSSTNGGRHAIAVNPETGKLWVVVNQAAYYYDPASQSWHQLGHASGDEGEIEQHGQMKLIFKHGSNKPYLGIDSSEAVWTYDNQTQIWSRVKNAAPRCCPANDPKYVSDCEFGGYLYTLGMSLGSGSQASDPLIAMFWGDSYDWGENKGGVMLEWNASDASWNFLGSQDEARDAGGRRRRGYEQKCRNQVPQFGNPYGTFSGVVMQDGTPYAALADRDDYSLQVWTYDRTTQYFTELPRPGATLNGNYLSQARLLVSPWNELLLFWVEKTESWYGNLQLRKYNFDASGWDVLGANMTDVSTMLFYPFFVQDTLALAYMDKDQQPRMAYIV